MTNHNTKILFVLTSLDQGGAETYLLRFLRYSGLKNSHVLCKGKQGGDLEDRYKKVCENIAFIPLDHTRTIAYFGLYKYIKAHKFTTICDFTGNFSGPVLATAYFGGIHKRLSFYRSSTDHFESSLPKHLYNKFMRAITLRFSTKIMANSQAALDYFYPKIKRQNERFMVIYNGLDTSDINTSSDSNMRSELGIPESAFVVGHLGRLCKSKNHDTIIQTALRLCSQHKNIHFVLAGRGVDTAYSSTIKHANLERQIHLLGYQNDVVKVLKTLDLFYFPSISEGQPNALIEAMIVGLPIIASNIKPIQETVPEYFIKYLICATDIDEAADKIEKLSKNSDLSEKYTLKEWATEHFDAKRLFNQFEKEL